MLTSNAKPMILRCRCFMELLHQFARKYHKNAGEQRNIKTEFSDNKKLQKLSDHYNNVPAA